MSSLLAIQGVLFGARFPIHNELTLGRSPGATIMLPDLQASRLHATVRREGESFLAVDTTSRNGTFINGERVQGERLLVSGDELQIGSSRFLFDAREEILPTRYGSAWVIVGGTPLAEGAGTRDISDEPRDDAFHSASSEDSRGLRELTASTVDEEGLSRSLLQWLMERVGATRGVLFTLRPEKTPVPLLVLPAGGLMSIHASLLTRGLRGGATGYRGVLELSRFTQGHRALEAQTLEVLAVPWRLGGEPGGLVWLERDAGELSFEDEALERVASLLKKAGPALENARRLRISRRRQRAEAVRDDGERIPARVFLEHAGLFERTRELARDTQSVAVVGPRGTGKDRVARLVHNLSPRWEGPLVRLNCASLSETQALLELFGGERGSLPGMDQPFPGKLELADGGTLVLEQVDALGFSVQEALMRALTLREVHRRAGEQPIPIDVRIVSTSARALQQWVAEERLRPDLLPWLGAERLTLPGLDELRKHIVPLAMTRVGRMNVRLARSVRGLTSAAEQALLNREWALNLWELEDLLIRAMTVAEGEELGLEDLDLADVMPGRWGVEEGAGAGRRLSDTLRDAERRLVVQALRLAKGHRGEAADLLGMSRAMLDRKMLEYAIVPQRL